MQGIKARWALVLLVTVLSIGAGAVAALVAPMVYVGTATLALRWVGAQPGVAELANVRYLAREAESVAVLVERPSVVERASRDVGLELETEDALRAVSAEVPLDSQLVKVSAEADTPERAAAFATSVAETLVIDANEEGFAPDAEAFMVLSAVPPTSYSEPRLMLYLIAGLLAGLVAGIAASSVLFLSERRTVPVSASARVAPGEERRWKALQTPHLVWVLVVAASIPWRTDTFYEGGADPVVIAKAGLSLVALGISAWAAFRAPHRYPLPATPVLLLLVYVAVTLVGGLANDAIVPSAVVAVRVAILAAAVCLLAVTTPAFQLFRALIQVLGISVALSALSGMPSYSGRLSGVMPPMVHNLLAMLTCIVAIWLLSKILTGKDTFWELFGLGGCLLVIFLTGSRTSLGAFAAAAAAMVLRMTALRMRTVALIALSLPVVTFIVLGTNLLQEVLTRGGNEDVGSLSNRTIAWNAAFSMERDGWQTWFGQGLAQKKISVPGQWWDTQMLDSSWVSALVQGGYLGTAVVILLATITLLRALFGPRQDGPLWFGLAFYLVFTGFLESGLFDGTVQFMVFLVAALGAFSAQRRTTHQRPSVLEPAGRPMAEATSAGRGSAIEP